LKRTRARLEKFETLGFELRTPIAFFTEGGDQIDPASEPHLEDLARIMKEEESIYVTLVGHADPSGDPSFNDALARKRAEAVARQLEKRGIAKDRIEVVSLGETEVTPEGSALPQFHRRVDIQIGVGEAYAH